MDPQRLPGIRADSVCDSEPETGTSTRSTSVVIEKGKSFVSKAKRRADACRAAALVVEDELQDLLSMLPQHQRGFLARYFDKLEEVEEVEEVEELAALPGDASDASDDERHREPLPKCSERGCSSPLLPLTKFCAVHIRKDPAQRLYL